MLGRDELNILARKLGIAKESASDRSAFRKLKNFFYGFLPKRTKITQSVLFIPECRKVVEEFLDVSLKLKSLDESQLLKLAKQVRIKDVPSDKTSLVKKILEYAECKVIANALNIRRIIAIRFLFLISVGLIAYFCHPPELVWGALKFLEFIGTWLGSIASIAGFFPIPSEDPDWRKRISSWWMTNRLDVIVILLFLLFYIHPQKIPLLGIIASLASIAAVLFNFFMNDWYDEHFFKVYNGIIVILVGILFWSHYFVITGKVVDEATKNKEGISAKVELVGISKAQRNLCGTELQWALCDMKKGEANNKISELQQKFCEGEAEDKISKLQREFCDIKKGEAEDKISDIQRNFCKRIWFHNVVDSLGFCGMETKEEEDGRFVLRILPSLDMITKDIKIKIKATCDNCEFKEETLEWPGGRKKEINIPLRRNLLIGKWICGLENDSKRKNLTISWVDKLKREQIFIKEEGNSPLSIYYKFQGKEQFDYNSSSKSQKIEKKGILGTLGKKVDVKLSLDKKGILHGNISNDKFFCNRIEKKDK